MSTGRKVLIAGQEKKSRDHVTVGQLISDDQQRDAIHVAVAPVVASCSLAPGQAIGFVVDGNETIVGVSDKPLGIVDPFLKELIKKDDRFFMFLFPNTVTGMRHEWQHPAFSEQSSNTLISSKEASEAWLRAYAITHNTYDDSSMAYERLIQGLRTGSLYFYGSDLHGLDELDDADELKRHAENVLGIRIAWEDFSFTCSC